MTTPQPNPTHHVPVFCENTATIVTASPRVLLLGNPGEGKTTSALTFPNPIVLDFDNQLDKFKDLNIPYVKFFDTTYLEKTFKSSIPCLALMKFLKDEGKKFSKEQTLIIDSLSALKDSVQEYYWNITPNAKGSTEKDGFAFWDFVKDYWIALHVELMRLQCAVVVCGHLAEVRHKDNGMLIGFKPLVEGSFKQEIGRFYTDVLRCKVSSKVEGQGDLRKVTPDYLWQIRTGDFVECKTRIKSNEMFVKANYTSFNL